MGQGISIILDGELSENLAKDAIGTQERGNTTCGS